MYYKIKYKQFMKSIRAKRYFKNTKHEQTFEFPYLVVAKSHRSSAKGSK